jgi:hypothetical protein
MQCRGRTKTRRKGMVCVAACVAPSHVEELLWYVYQSYGQIWNEKEIRCISIAKIGSGQGHYWAGCERVCLAGWLTRYETSIGQASFTTNGHARSR